MNKYHIIYDYFIRTFIWAFILSSFLLITQLKGLLNFYYFYYFLFILHLINVQLVLVDRFAILNAVSSGDVMIILRMDLSAIFG